MKRTYPSAKVRLLDAAMQVIRTKGYTATTVDNLCEAAGVTKGAFFHHFESKEELAIEAAEHFANMAEGFFAQAPYRQLANPVDRILGYVDFRIEILRGPIPDFTCLLGTMVQEAYESHPAIRYACKRHMEDHTDVLIKDIELAMAQSTHGATWTPASLGYHILAVIQGAFVLAKAQGGPAVATDCLRHLRNYLQLLFKPGQTTTNS